jgi:hypothetical protein
MCNVITSLASCAVYLNRTVGIQPLQLTDVLVKHLLDLQGALLGVSGLAVLVVDIRDTKARLVTFGPFKVTARQSAKVRRGEIYRTTYSIRLQAI